MNAALIIGLLIVCGLSVGWVLHHRSVRSVTPILRRLVAERNGTVESRSPFLLPKLLFSHAGAPVEVSSASDGESAPYTYALFSGLDLKGFEFRILPRSLQTMGDNWIGLKNPIATAGGTPEKRLAIYTNDDRLMEVILSDRIEADLLSWAKEKRENRISDIRADEHGLMYAVTGTLDSYEEYRLLLDTACRFYETVAAAVSNKPDSVGRYRTTTSTGAATLTR